jgi:hypothetical protein
MQDRSSSGSDTLYQILTVFVSPDPVSVNLGVGSTYRYYNIPLFGKWVEKASLAIAHMKAVKVPTLGLTRQMAGRCEH